jgi:hypothetical protein
LPANNIEKAHRIVDQKYWMTEEKQSIDLNFTGLLLRIMYASVGHVAVIMGPRAGVQNLVWTVFLLSEDHELDWAAWPSWFRVKVRLGVSHNLMQQQRVGLLSH